MTVKELWDVTTCELFVAPQDAPLRRQKLLAGSERLRELGDCKVYRVDIWKRASESPALVLEIGEGHL